MNKKAVNRAGMCGASDQATSDSVVSSWLPVAFKNERTFQVQASQMSSLDSNMAYSHWQQCLTHQSGTNTWGIHFPSWGGCVQKAGQLLSWTLLTCILIRCKRECKERKTTGQSGRWSEFWTSFDFADIALICRASNHGLLCYDKFVINYKWSNCRYFSQFAAQFRKHQWKNSSSTWLRLCLIKEELFLTAPGAFRHCLPQGRDEQQG